MGTSSLVRYLLVGLGICTALTLVMSIGLSIAVRYGLTQLEQQGADFLPTAPPDPTLQKP